MCFVKNLNNSNNNLKEQKSSGERMNERMSHLWTWYDEHELDFIVIKIVILLNLIHDDQYSDWLIDYHLIVGVWSDTRVFVFCVTEHYLNSFCTDDSFALFLL